MCLYLETYLGSSFMFFLSFLWHVWKACNSFRFDSTSFSADVINRVVLDFRLASYAFGFKLS